MIYRMRIYQAVSGQLDTFNQFFNEHLLPVQRRHGARLVGRYQTDDERIFAVWEYDSREAYEDIQAKVSKDPDSKAAQEYRKTLPVFAEKLEELFMTDTVFPMNQMSLSG